MTVADLRGRKIRFRAYTLSEDNGVIDTNNNSRDNLMHAFRIRPEQEVIHYDYARLMLLMRLFWFYFRSP